jgi:hypothetical protein
MRRAIASGGQLRLIYPDEVCFAFNPNYLEIESRGISTLNIKVGVVAEGTIRRQRSIAISVYNTKTNVYLSRLFALLFEEPEHTRSLKVNVQVLNGQSTLYSFDTLVIWGGLAPGERFNAFGVFRDENNKRQFERNLVWFKRFPFQVSVFKYSSDVKFQSRVDGGMYGDPFTGVRASYTINEIDEFTTPTAVEGSYTDSTGGTLIFFSSTRQILLKHPGSGQYYKVWGGGVHRGPSSVMVDGNNRPLVNADYIITDEDGMQWRYRFDGANLVNSGIVQDVGFVTLYPSDLFPATQRNATIKYKIGEELSMFSTFDNTFDYTFFQSGQTLAIVNLTVSYETAGHYLRWIDNQGNLQFYLFAKGKRSSKTKLGKNNIIINTPLRGMYFSNMQRNTSVELNVTHKCAAVHLTADMFEWVSTIITSPIIDMYLGKDIDGNEIWVPVVIQASTVEYDNKQQLHDLEITFEAPAHNAQSL